MTKPTTRETFITNCKRRLGFPVIEINLDEDQIQDRVDEALDLYHQFHHEGQYPVYLTHQITASDITNKYITLDEEVIGVRRILSIQEKNLSSGMFDIRYQMRLNDFQSYGVASGNMSGYISQRQYLELMNQVLVGEAPIRYNRHMDRLYIDIDWDADIAADDYIVIEGYQIVDPETYTDVYSDRMLQKYCAALLKQQWGTNMKKYQGVQLIGGVEMNGQTIYDEAREELRDLKDEIRREWELPTMFITG